MDEEQRVEIRKEFRRRVNMSPSELEEWLATDESREVGDSSGGESTGHRSGRRIVKLLRSTVDELGDSDHEHMRKVNGYIARHLGEGQRPASDVETSPWRRSLMNWGHDPLK